MGKGRGAVSSEGFSPLLLAEDVEELTARLHGHEGIDTDTTLETESFGAGGAVVEGAFPSAFGVTSVVVHSSSLGVVEVSVDNLREVWHFDFRSNAARAEAGRKALSKEGWNLIPRCQ